MNYRKLTLNDKPLIDSYLKECATYGSTFSLAYLASWSYFDFGNMEIAEEDNSLIFRFQHKGNTHYLVLSTHVRFCELVEKIFDENPAAWIVQVEKDYVDTLDTAKYDIDEKEDFDEYLYSPEDLIELKGKKYHGKRGHIKKFMTLYPDYIFRDYENKDRDAVMQLFDSWEESKGVDVDGKEGLELDSEKAVIGYMLDNIDLFELKASVIEVDGKLIAFTMGEVLASGVGVVHIEKGNYDYDGVYPTINKLFAEKYFKDCKYVNRQEDIGIEGLRKAKRSYYPIRMSEKCIVRKKRD